MTKMKRDFLIFHYKNQELWKWINYFALDRARAGHQHFGMQNVVERARWETSITVKTGKFKIRNEYVAFYARLWHLVHPEYKDFFRTRPIPDDFLPDCDDYGPITDAEEAA